MLCSAATELLLMLMLMFSVASSARLSIPEREIPPFVALFQVPPPKKRVLGFFFRGSRNL